MAQAYRINKTSGRGLRFAVVAAVAFVVSACAQHEPLASGAAAAPPPADNRPNIIYILADDLGYGDIGAYGQTITRTPVLDQLAREGMVFTRHYAGSTVCAPSRASLMTGRDTGHVSVRGNKELGDYTDAGERGQMPLPLEETTVAEMLEHAGYATGMVGKWGLGGPGSISEPQKRGFDYFYGYLDQKQSHNYYPTHLWENGKRVPLNNRFFIPHPYLAGTSTRPEDYRMYMGNDYSTDFLTKAAVGWLDSQKGSQEPLFLYLAYTTPHAALQVPDEELEAYADIPEMPAKETNYTPHPRARAARAAMITRMDRDIGRVLDTLRANGQLDNTLIIFTSDNGAGSEGGADLEFFDATGGLRGEKRDLYEGGIRTPMIAWWPGRIAAGTSSDHISAFWDVMPTLAELAGTTPPAHANGVSFLPSLLGGKQAEHDHLYWEFVHEKLGAQAVMLGRYKVIRFRPSNKGGEVTGIEMYDLETDRAEQHNIAAQHPDIVARAVAIMDQRVPSPVEGFNFGETLKH